MIPMKTTIGLLAMVAGAFAPAPPAPAPAATPSPEPGLYATINTSLGAIKVKFFEKEAPITVKNFRALAMGTKAWKEDRKSTRLNSSHLGISYAVFCLK